MNITFGPADSYSLEKAEPLIRDTARKLRQRLAQSHVLPAIDTEYERAIITDPSDVWDIIRFKFSAEDTKHTGSPHVSIGIGRDVFASHAHDFLVVWVNLILPHNAKPEYWRRLHDATLAQLTRLAVSVVDGVRPIRNHIVRNVYEPMLYLKLYQRHYYHQQHPLWDGLLKFNVDTFLDSAHRMVPVKTGESTKSVKSWIEALRTILVNTNLANFEAAISAEFPVTDNGLCKDEDFVASLAVAAESFAPFLAFLRD